ncbi:hypothetical protein [Lactiplantibacillus argentoratensis]|uniref:hypothetical protein n=1 Tax=Lactiplantibacillus argentoratensis TaxID=271881 RepID=UPI0021CB1B8C|nr:hypothetical protein [Lactiplantibacillus argentoratensis]
MPQIAALLGAGKVANMPLFKPLADDDPQVPDDTTDLLVNKITTDLAQARKLGFDQAWSATDLSAELSGADPLSAIGDQSAIIGHMSMKSYYYKSRRGI